MPAERVLTERELNRAVLARQGLLEPLDRTIPQALAAIGGLQARTRRRCTSGSGRGWAASSSAAR
jgi:hypothetical protein